MPIYTPPVEDMLHALFDLADFSDSPGAQGLDAETLVAVLSESGKLAADVLAPLNAVGDRQGAVWKDGVVTMPDGFRSAYGAYCAGGWNALPFPTDFGGQGLPWAAAFPVQEMWQAANLSFGLCPLLNQGTVEALFHHGSAAQKALYLPRLISGQWAGTMNLTEPQAGSDLGEICARAIPQADGTYKITGQKIFITYGEHDLTENIIHLVLARTPDAPPGPKGISLFIVPKYRVTPEGTLGARNDVRCVSIEHKLGIHASPTCTMVYGDEGGAIGDRVGAENEGLKYMFTMMNNARLSVGLQGVAIAERATQAALAYAQERVQGADLKTRARGAIIRHPDVRRMLLTMQALTRAARALAYEAAVNIDRARAGDELAQGMVDLMTPVVKGWGTEVAQIVTNLALQVHGGMGYVEETGVAQYVRDSRILPIYEGTNGIQAADLVFRKVLKDEGHTVARWLHGTGGVVEALAARDPHRAAGLMAARDALNGVTRKILETGKHDSDEVAVMSTPYLHLMGTVAGGMMMAKSLLSETGKQQQHQQVARFYLTQILPLSEGFARQISAGGRDVLEAVFPG